MNTPPGFVGVGDSFLFIYFMFYLYWYSYIVYILFVTQLPSLERWALLPFGGFSYPNLLLVFSEPVIFRNLYYIFLASVGLSLGLFFIYFYRIFLYLILG